MNSRRNVAIPVNLRPPCVALRRDIRYGTVVNSEQVRVQVECVCLPPSESGAPNREQAAGGLVGRVSDCGEAASAHLHARVLVAPVSSCGECDTCRRGFAPVCPHRTLPHLDSNGETPGTIVTNARWLTHLVGGLADITGPQGACLAGPALLAYTAFCRTGMNAGEVAIVLGAGPVAHILQTLIRSRGAKSICCSGPPAATDVQTFLATLDSHPTAPLRIFVCDDCDANLATATEIATPGSILAVCGPQGMIPAAVLGAKSLTLLGVLWGHPDLLPELAALVAKGDLELAPHLLAFSAGEPIDVASNRDKCLVVSMAQ